jgi:insertion element IS1 protein InsB
MVACVERLFDTKGLTHFVARKTNQQWIWLAICRHTRQIVGYAIGARDEITCRKLWQSIPPAYRRGRVESDFWKAYQVVGPTWHHGVVGKERGQTSRIERFTTTLRQRLARFVRKTLSFSPSLVMHEICLRLFLWR